jgi:hypothetical protein
MQILEGILSRIVALRGEENSSKICIKIFQEICAQIPHLIAENIQKVI